MTMRREWDRNFVRAQGLEQDLAQNGPHYPKSWLRLKPSREKRHWLANNIEEEMVHWTQVSFLLHLHLQQAKIYKAQSNKIKCLSTIGETTNHPGAVPETAEWYISDASFSAPPS